jgi:hypothetical protein
MLCDLRFSRGLGIFVFSTAFRPVLEPNWSPIQWVPGALSPRVKRLGCEAGHSPPSSTEVKKAWRYTSTPQIRLHGVVLSYGGELCGQDVPTPLLPCHCFQPPYDTTFGHKTAYKMGGSRRQNAQSTRHALLNSAACLIDKICQMFA